MTNDQRQKVIVITGPTASGKSSLAVELALALDGEIVNADSMQVYRGMDVGTAKPTLPERRGIDHHLMDVVDPDDAFNAAIFRTMAIPLIKEIGARGRACLVVGGTGLYIKTLLGGLVHCPPGDENIRQSLTEAWNTMGPGTLHARVKKLDPEAARKIHPNDRVRILRALEIMTLTGQSLTFLHDKHQFQERPFRALKICLYTERSYLYEKINRRSLQMVKNGLVQETKGLLEKGYSPRLKPMRSLGYRHMTGYLAGKYGLDRAILDLQRDTRHYAKRQLTWFRADKTMNWVRPEEFRKVLEMSTDFHRDTA